jgi:hypothetical protein
MFIKRTVSPSKLWASKKALIGMRRGSNCPAPVAHGREKHARLRFAYDRSDIEPAAAGRGRDRKRDDSVTLPPTLFLQTEASAQVNAVVMTLAKGGDSLVRERCIGVASGPKSHRSVTKSKMIFHGSSNVEV